MIGRLLHESWLVLVLAAFVAASLAATDRALAPRIAENARRRLREAAVAVVPGGAALREETAAGRPVHRVVDASGASVGWAVPADGAGFQDTIRLLIGLDASAREITGVIVLDARETPGLGDRIAAPEYTGRFVGQPAGGEVAVDGITGATISSRAMVAIVRAALAEVQPALEERSRQP